MERSELECNSQIIFEKELNDLTRHLKTYTIEESKDGNIIKYPNAETLIDLFSTVQNDGKLKSFFVDILSKQVTDSGEVTSESIIFGQGYSYIGTSPLCFYTLVKLGFVNEAIEALKRRNKTWRGIYHLIYELVPKNHFDKSQLKEIAAKLRVDSIYFWSEGKDLLSKVIDSRYELLKKQIKAVNVEINQDRKTVSEKISLFGFDSSYTELLDGIDQFISSETMKFVNAGMISNLRTFLGKLLKDVANKVADKRKERIPTIEGRSEMGNIRSYLKSNLELSENDDNFINSFINILHSEGGHAFASEKEYFRLARNIAIEIALFVLSKYERKFKSF